MVAETNGSALLVGNNMVFGDGVRIEWSLRLVSVEQSRAEALERQRVVVLEKATDSAVAVTWEGWAEAHCECARILWVQ